ncbi:hypothetical protein JCM1841_001893 [Sporobolomyces salmonicolor]
MPSSSAKESNGKGGKPPKKKARRIAPPSHSDDDHRSIDDASLDDEATENSDIEVIESDSSNEKGKRKAKAKGTDKKPGKKSKEVKGKRVAKNESKGKKPKGKTKCKVKDDSDDDGDAYSARDAATSSEEEEDEDDFEDGGKNTRVVRELKKIPAPKVNADTKVILPTTMEFLNDLRGHNDREWFQANDARYRHALANFKAFLTAWVPRASEADWSLPHLPTKDLIHRIYRDVRFSKDKTPYKTNLSFSHSRTGRKGPFGLYYFHISPNGRSMLGCGCWSPASNELKLIRNAILRDPQPLRDVIAEPEFVKLFGEPKARADKQRSSIFGGEDELKNAPKIEGVDKNHKDIDLLKCRSFAVMTNFDDDDVTSPDFLDQLVKAIEVAAPFVQLLNEMISPSPPSDDDADDGARGGGGNGAHRAGSDEEEEEQEEPEED